MGEEASQCLLYTGIVILVQYFRIFHRNCLSFEFLNSILLVQHMNAETNKASCQSGFICLIAEIDVPHNNQFN